MSARHGFLALFGRPHEAASEAPGRIDLMGEHSDYNGGLSLSVATPHSTSVELARRADRLVRAVSAAIGGDPVEYELGREGRRGHWIDYVAGVTSALAGEGIGLPAGFDLRITSHLPLGAGLSSSAALEVSLLRGLRALFGLPLDDVRIAKLGHRAEAELGAAPSPAAGPADQMASSLAGTRTALLLDTRTLEYELVHLPRELELVVIDAGIERARAGGERADRRAECERAAALLGVARLCERLDYPEDRLAALPPPLGRRVRHVLRESARVRAAAEALRARDLRALGQLLAASHASMRDDYEVSTPEIDTLVALAGAEPAIYGARLTGDGSGGAVVMAARRGTGRDEAERIARLYAQATGRAPAVLLPRAAIRA